MTLMKTTANEFCVPGRFWTKLPARERSQEELKTLRELAALMAEEKADEEAALTEWLEG